MQPFRTIFPIFLALSHVSNVSSRGDCEKMDMTEDAPLFKQAGKCANFLNSLKESELEKKSEVKGKQILAGLLKEKTAKTLLSARKLMVEKVVVEDTTWQTISIGAKEVHKSFSLTIEGNPLLTRIDFDPEVLKEKTLKIRGNRLLSHETIDRLKAINSTKWSIQEFGECAISTSLTDFAQVDGCRSLTREISFEGQDSIEGTPKIMILGTDSCLSISNTNLTSLAFLDISAASLRKACPNAIEKNPNLCLSETRKMEFKSVFKGMKIRNNDGKCKFECLAEEILNGSVSNNRTCYVVRGELVLEGVSDKSGSIFDFSTVAEIRGGGLKIRKSIFSFVNLFPNLLAIDMENSTGPAVEITDSQFSQFPFPSLLKIYGTTSEGPVIVLKNNKGIEDEERWNRLAGGRLEIIFEGEGNETLNATTGRTTTRTPRRTTEGMKHNDDGEKKKEFPWLAVYIASGAGVTLILLLILVPIILILGFKGSFSLPKLKRISETKRNLLRELTEEILQMNPLEWRRAMMDEAQHPKNSAEKSNIRIALREKYALFLEKTYANPPIRFRPPSEAKDSDVFGYLKKFFLQTNGKAALILLSKHSDPSVSLAVLAGKRGETKKISGFKKEEETSATTVTTKENTTMKDGMTAKETDLEAGGRKFEVTTTLLKTKKINEDMMVYTYRITLGEEELGKTRKSIVFKMKVINYHTWASGPVPKDNTTILRLCEYARAKKAVFATCSTIHSFTFLMNKAVFDHLVFKEYPKITIRELKIFISDMVELMSIPDEALLFSMVVVLEWATREKVIPCHRETAYKDFVHVYEKLVKYMLEHPNNFFFEVKDLGLSNEVSKRVMETGVSLAPVPKEVTMEQTMSVMGNPEDSSTDDKRNAPSKMSQMQEEENSTKKRVFQV